MSLHKRGDTITIGFIGAGNVGFALGKYFTSHGIQTAGYYSRRTESAQTAAAFTHTVAYETIGELIAVCDVLFLTVPDDQISAVYRQVCQHSIQGKRICHCSGALSSRDTFPEIGEKGAFGYSVHPLFAVSDRYGAYRELTGAFFALEGDPIYRAELQAMLEHIGFRVKLLEPEQKTRYHCAAVMASNWMVVLVQAAIEELNRCGFSDREALTALTPLLEGNLRHIIAEGTVKSLTGPVERGDAETVRGHLACLNTPEERQLYRLMTGRLLSLAERKHPERKYERLKQLLQKENARQ